MTVHVFGIPNCPTVKKSLAWFETQHIDTVFVNYRTTPPDRATVAHWVASLGAKALKNTSGGSYRALPAEKTEWDDTQWIDAFTNDPMLIKRPSLVRDGIALQAGFRATPEELTERFKQDLSASHT